MENLNEIKKALYRQKPKSNLTVRTNTGLKFKCKLENDQVINFYVPLSEITEHHVDGVDAQLLIRWIER
jgi:hypothetical protein